MKKSFDDVRGASSVVSFNTVFIAYELLDTIPSESLCWLVTRDE